LIGLCGTCGFCEPKQALDEIWPIVEIEGRHKQRLDGRQVGQPLVVLQLGDLLAAVANGDR
jgi:hypothetical protein